MKQQIYTDDKFKRRVYHITAKFSAGNWQQLRASSFGDDDEAQTGLGTNRKLTLNLFAHRGHELNQYSNIHNPIILYTQRLLSYIHNFFFLHIHIFKYVIIYLYFCLGPLSFHSSHCYIFIHTQKTLHRGPKLYKLLANFLYCLPKAIFAFSPVGSLRPPRHHHRFTSSMCITHGPIIFF